jgi:adenylate cyclase
MQNDRRKRLTQGTLIGLAAAIISTALYGAGALQWVETKTWDWRVRQFAKPGLATDHICTIIIDQSSLDDAEDLFGLTWMWPREIYGAILAFCQRGGAKAVAFDMVFTEGSALGVSDDETFGQAIANGLPCVAALPLSNKEQGGADRWADNAPSPFSQADRIFENNQTLLKQLTLQRASFPIPEVTTNLAMLGNVAAIPDNDAVFRRAPIGQVFDNHFVPTLGLAAFLAANPDATITTTKKGIKLGPHDIPLSKQGQAILRFRGRSQTHLTLNATAVLQSELRLREGGTPIIDPAVVKDRYVLFGVTATGLMDLKPTPMGRTYPGVEVHATLLDNLLSDDFAKELPVPIVVMLTLLLGLIAGIVGRQCNNWHQTTLSFIVLLATPLLAGYAAYPVHIWFPVAPLGTAAGLALLTAVIVNYAIEGHQKRFIKGAFKQYLSPIVIEKLMQDPDRLQLGGEEKTLSIFFSDIQGFTSISEGLTPTELTSLLNTYLTAMTDVIHETGGTIDKYEGDAIIAFWNAPLEQEDHAKRAVRAALTCQATLAAMRPGLKTQYGSDIHVRIGVNTGPVVVGNMGSHQRFDYTFLGDAGNLAARLEGINKQFGTFLMISEFTKDAISDEFPSRELSRVRVVGKALPVTVYEPFLVDDYSKRDTELKAFDEALQLYYAGSFSTAQAQFQALADSDPTARIYAKRCATLNEAPPPDWEGIWIMTEK